MDTTYRPKPGVRILRLADLRARGIVRSRTTLWRWISRGEFPAPIQLSVRAQGWPENVVDDWVASRPQKRTVEPGSTR